MCYINYLLLVLPWSEVVTHNYDLLVLQAVWFMTVLALGFTQLA